MNAIQEERVRGYFLNAAKDLIRAEGIQVVSARNVAERAGYSYATLYNYFKDIRDLIFSCIEDFMKECSDFVKNDTIGSKPGKERLQKRVKNYVKFFVQYPGIFALLYQQKPSEMSTNSSNISSIYGFFETLIDEDLKTLYASSDFTEKECFTYSENFKYSIHGSLLFYLNRRKEIGFKEYINEIGNLTELFVLSCSGRTK